MFIIEEMKIENKPASKDPFNSSPFGTNSNIVIFWIVKWCHLAMEIIDFGLEARKSFIGF